MSVSAPAQGRPPQPYPVFLSIVIVDRDDEGPLAAMLPDVVAAVTPMVADFEIILVDNGSGPQGRERYDRLTAMDGLPNLQVYHLLQTVDAEVAYWAGIENSLGDYVLAFDPYNEDLSELPRAIEHALAGKDVVLIRNVAPEAGRGGERMAARLFRRLYRATYGIELTADAAQHRLISKKVVSFLLQLPRPALRYRALPSTAGFLRETITYRAARRPKRDHSFGTRARRALNLVFTSTLMPLRLVSMLALFGSVANLIYSGYVLIVTVLRSDVAPGWTTMSLQQSGMFFLISLVLFVLTEYMIRVVQWTMDGAPYFVTGESTSSTLTRMARLNVETHLNAETMPTVAR